MSDAFRVMRIVFETREELDHEWSLNVANGGLFLPGRFDLLNGEPVFVFVDLPFANAAIDVEGHVAQCIPVELEENGGRCGVAVELPGDPERLRARIEQAIGEPFARAAPGSEADRVAPRSVAHVRAQVHVPGAGRLEGRTRNLSLAGVLVGLTGEAPPVGREVVVELAHAPSGEVRSIPGVVARHDLDAQDALCGIGVQFDAAAARAGDTAAFLNRVKASEHARRLGGIAGSIDTLGIADLLMSFGQCVPRGRFTLTHEGRVGTVHVAEGRMSCVQLEAAVGVKALMRIMDWAGGSFEFHADLVPDEDAPSLELPIEMALLEATRLLDESRRFGPSQLPSAAVLRAAPIEVDLEDPACSKLDRQILELAEQGGSVARLLGAIAEPDRLIEERVFELVERGALRIEDLAYAS